VLRLLAGRIELVGQCGPDPLSGGVARGTEWHLVGDIRDDPRDRHRLLSSDVVVIVGDEIEFTCS